MNGIILKFTTCVDPRGKPGPAEGQWSWAPSFRCQSWDKASSQAQDHHNIFPSNQSSAPTVLLKQGGSLASSTSALNLQPLLAQMDGSHLYHRSASLEIPGALTELVAEYLCLFHCPLAPQQPCAAS